MSESDKQKKDTQARQYTIVINNPLDKNFDHNKIRETVLSFPSLVYACFADEISESKTPHTHIFIRTKHPVKHSTMRNKFKGAHVETAHGSIEENIAYIKKSGKWANTAKAHTNIKESFNEIGTLPQSHQGKRTDLELLLQMINDGYSTAEIITAQPQFINYLNHIERVRQSLREDEFRNVWRDVSVVYLFGETESNKTRSVMEKYSYENVYRITNYNGNAIWDGYRGQDVVIFEEFRSQIMISELLTWLEGYPNASLRARYSDKVACYTRVYIISNIPLEEQYPNVQTDSPATWRAFLRRIHQIIWHKSKNEIITYNSVQEYMDRNNHFQPLDKKTKTPFDDDTNDTDEQEQLSMPFD